ncbi:excalibur calcium-binding domain-containing protein [Priestia aryabhattai]|uniref:excalibur calcium-binding domain-containing protein n=1 Tax=Priestia aryabhattai TaxID=412384 RepID=UPI002E1C2E07|nr:excalibur calcium-binding domain-containing protein [Priestia aryabhattai]MED4257737.1 excalibur calcium-binding domain-containing protein [Priestia aryabhattai]
MSQKKGSNEKKESESALTQRLIREKHWDTWSIQSASIGKKGNSGEYGAFLKDKLIIYKLMDNKQLIQTSELIWPENKHGEVDHFTLKSIFHLDGKDFVVSPQGKDVQKFLEGEKKNTFTKVPRKFYQKILGFRSKKRWKQITASLIYLFIISFIIGFFNGEDETSTNVPATKNVTTETTSPTNDLSVEKKEKESKTVVKMDPNKPVTFKNGDYTVDDDILPGNYIASTKDKVGGNFAVYRRGNSNAIVNEILGTELEPPLMYNDLDIKLKKGDTIKLKSFETNVVFTPISDEELKKRTAEEEAAKVEQARKAEEAKKEAEAAEAKRQTEQQAAADKAAQEASQSTNTNVFYANCSEVEAAGAAPISQGEPGYSRKLDRDGDGIACDQ